jgi:hypothetical protein
MTNNVLNHLDRVPKGTVSRKSAELGYNHEEPLLVAMDGMYRYAAAYEKRFEGKLAEDYVLGPEWLKVVTGLRGLLNGDGAVAMELGISTDSKDNGMIEGMFWDAMKVAGFEEKDI